MDIDTNDPISKMEAELFITGRAQFEYPIPYKSEGGYLRDLQQGAMGDKLKALRAIIHTYRGKNAFTGGYTRESAEGAAAIFNKFASGPELSEAASRELFLEGSVCENCGDYEGATWFFEASLHFENPDKEFCYYRLNNLAFNLLCLNKFKEAEVYLEKAIKLMPKRYNSWKNAGVAMEHQGKIEEAAKAYMFAINYSNAEKRSLKHLLRLIARHPELRQKEEITGYLDSLAKAGVIDKTGRA